MLGVERYFGASCYDCCSSSDNFKTNLLIDDEHSCFTYCGNVDTSSDDGKISTKSANPTIILGDHANIARMGGEGICYFYDPSNKLEKFINDGEGEIDVKYKRVTSHRDQLRKLIQIHFNQTGSVKAKFVLDNWNEAVNQFWQVHLTYSCVIFVI